MKPNSGETTVFVSHANLEQTIFLRPILCLGRRGGLMVSAFDCGSNGLGSGPGRRHRVVFLGKTLYSHSASLHPGV